MKSFPELENLSKPKWGPFQLRPNPLAILRLSFGTAGAISTAMLIPDMVALIPSSPDPLSLFCKAVGLWGYAYALWTTGFLSILHVVRIFSASIIIDEEGLKIGRFGGKILWSSIVAITVVERKIFSKLFFIPSYQLTLHIEKPDGKRQTKQLASFQYSPEEFFTLYYYIAKFSSGAAPSSLKSFVFRDIAEPDLRKIFDDGRLKSVALTAIISFGLVMFLARNAVKNYSFNMGNKEFRAGNYDKAVSYFSTATAVEFTFAQAWSKLAQCEFRLGDLDSAQADWTTSLRWKPDYVESKLGLSAIYMIRGKLDEATKLIESSNRLAPFDEAGYINRAQIELLTGKTTLAISRLKQFLKEPIGREQAICLLARAYLRQGRVDEAHTLLASNPAVLNNQFTRPFCTMVMAEIAAAKGDYKQADELLNSIRLMAAHQPDLLVDLAQMSLRHNDLKTARRQLETARVINPDNPWVALASAELAEKSGDDFVPYIKTAEKFPYQDPSLLAAIAKFQNSRGAKSEAQELAQRARMLDPENLIARNIVSSNLREAKNGSR